MQPNLREPIEIISESTDAHFDYLIEKVLANRF